MKVRTLFVVFVLLSWGRLLAAGPTPPSPPSMTGASRPTGEAGPVHDRIVREGIAIDVTVDPIEAVDPIKANGAKTLREGDEAVFRFHITDTATGTPLSGLAPAAWLNLVAPRVEDAAGCQDKVKEILSGSALAKPEIDLTSYQVLALNEDSTVTVVDPFFGFGSTKLLAMLFLDSPGEDWVLSADSKRLFITLPATHHLAVADTTAWKVTATLDTGARPRRVAFQPDQGYIWVTWEKGVDVFDPQSLKRVARIPTGRGGLEGHEIAFSGDSRFAFITNRADGAVSVIDVRRLAKIRDLRTGPEPVSVAWSSLGAAAWVSHLDGSLVAIDGEKAEPLARVQAEPGLGQIAFAPGGRYGFVVNPRADKVHILDASRNRLVQTAKVEKEPDEVTFSSELAYIRHRRSETVLMIPLGAVGEEGNAVSVVDFPGGQKAFGEGAGPVAAAGIVQAPGARAVLVAHPADRTVYYYKEGMAAPMGSFANYSRQPRAVLVVDRSLRERSPGTYETIARLRHPGHYDLAFFLDAPRVVDCLSLAVDPDPEKAKERRAALPPKVEYLTAERTARAGQPFILRLRILDPVTEEPRKDVHDVTLLGFAPPGARQSRQPAAQVEPGIYQAALVPDGPGTYYVYVESLSQGLEFRGSPPLTLNVQASASAGRGSPE
jgi:DNA-binding beta-propeller fold protein YncE